MAILSHLQQPFASRWRGKTPFGPPAPPAPQASLVNPDTVALDNAIGVKGKGQWRGSPVLSPTRTIPEVARRFPAMGTATVINFQLTGGGKAAITGDFVITADEVNP
jgi:hypothetical protein